MKSILNFLIKYKFYFFILSVCILLFWKFIFNGLIPLPADAIVGMYHPFRDYYAKEYPNGIPFNNPLITDPVRQQFVWKKLVMDDFKMGKLPVENPYSFSGYPLLANFQSGTFYIFNFLFFIFNFATAWGAYIFLQFFLGAIFMFAFLQNILSENANPEGVSTTEGSSHQQISFIGATVWILSGFWISWAEWGNILHTAMWLPLILLAIDRIITVRADQEVRPYEKYFWITTYLFSLVFAFFAGHLQTFFYLYLFSAAYFAYRLYHIKNKIQIVLLFTLLSITFYLLTVLQWLPTLQFILQSARSTDVAHVLTRPDWFIPPQHLIQLFIPDFFGNPAKGNYWGVWNYGEYLSYVGIIPIFFALIEILYSIKKRKNLFFTTALFVVLLFALKNPVSEIPYLLQIPFFSTAQPSRLILLLNFLFVVFFSQGIMQMFTKKNIHESIRGYVILFILVVALAVMSLYQVKFQAVILRNLVQPVAVFLIFLSILFFFKNRKIILLGIFLLTFFDQSRVFWRFNTFSPQKYIFPESTTIRFLKQKQKEGFFRVASLDPAIMPPNFFAYYKIPDIAGYDPLYFSSYANLLSGQENPRFNRIVGVTFANEKLFDQLQVKYVLSFDDLPKSQYKLVFQEGKTKTFEYLGLK